MLYNMSWLQEGQPFPPVSEQPRLQRYQENASLFDGEHFSDAALRNRSTESFAVPLKMALYDKCCARIEKVIGNFDDVVSFPVLLNYQRFLSTKMADLVAGEQPLITGKDEAESAKIQWVMDNTNFYEKLYSIVIDLSRYGDCPIRVFKNEVTDFYDWTIWDASQWFPIVSQDGTYRILKHCLAWLEDVAPSTENEHDYYLHVQEFDVKVPNEYTEYVFHNGTSKGKIGALVSGYPKVVTTGFDSCPVFNLRPYAVSGTVFGYDDYVAIDAIIAEIIVRVSQISVILDKHADPSMYGPMSLLSKNVNTGEFYFKRSKFYGLGEDGVTPGYLTWDGQLTAAFEQLKFLVNQLYILSEMGAAITGGEDASGNVVSGNALRFKMTNPLAKARRVTNSLTNPLRKLLSVICSNMPDIDAETAEPGGGEDTKLPFGHITIMWRDGLPNDPREDLEMCKLASGETKMLPMDVSLNTYLHKSAAEASELAKRLKQEAQEQQQRQLELSAQQNANPNKAGPQDGKGVNPMKKGSKTGLNSFQAPNNQKKEDK